MKTVMKNTGLLVNGESDLAKKELGRANAFFSSASTGKACLQQSQVLTEVKKSGARKTYLC